MAALGVAEPGRETNKDDRSHSFPGPHLGLYRPRPVPGTEGTARVPPSPSFKSTSSSDLSWERGRQMKAPLWTGQFRKVGRRRRRQRVLHSEIGKGNYDLIGIKGGCVQQYFPTLPAVPPLLYSDGTGQRPPCHKKTPHPALQPSSARAALYLAHHQRLLIVFFTPLASGVSGEGCA